MNKSTTQSKRTLVVLVILDGWGVAEDSEGNAIAQAKTPVMDQLLSSSPHTTLQASGQAVGLLESQVGNSEAGHMSLGAGRVVKQDVSLIHQAIAQGIFFKNPALEQAAQHTFKNHSNLHLMGLLSDEDSGHSNPLHIKSLLEFFRSRSVKNIYFHLFTDGRDTPPHASLGFIKRLASQLNENEKIVTVAGRLYLDRRKHWDMTEKIYHCLVAGDGVSSASAIKAVEEAYTRGETDEFILPTIIKEKSKKSQTRIGDRDAIVFFNLRSDRARQLTKPFVQKEFNKLNLGSFKRKRVIKDTIFVAMTDFGPDLGNILTAFPSADINKTLPWVLRDLRQLYISESEKFAQITYFFNGGWTDPIGGEVREKIQSSSVAHFDEEPAMAAHELTRQVVKHINNKSFDFITMNFANADMVAHTGNFDATKRACEIVDECLDDIKKAVLVQKGVLLISADHGNAEILRNVGSGEVDTEHNASPVPFVVTGLLSDPNKFSLRHDGKLADVAPTILDIMNIPQPEEMTGKSLILKKDNK